MAAVESSGFHKRWCLATNGGQLKRIGSFQTAKSIMGQKDAESGVGEAG